MLDAQIQLIWIILFILHSFLSIQRIFPEGIAAIVLFFWFQHRLEPLRVQHGIEQEKKGPGSLPPPPPYGWSGRQQLIMALFAALLWGDLFLAEAPFRRWIAFIIGNALVLILLGWLAAKQRRREERASLVEG